MTPVSLYIPCYNVGGTLDKVLHGVLAQTYAPDEIIVVDDGSTDTTLFVANHFPVTIVRHQSNRGLAAARNSGIRAARNELVASLDGDVFPDKDWLRHLMECFQFDPEQRLALVGGALHEANTDTVADFYRAFSLPQHLGDQPIKNPRIVFGADTIIRKSVVEKVGWYSERFRTNYEDMDMYRRILARGYAAFYQPAAIAMHLRRDSIRSIVRTQWRWNTEAYYTPICWQNTWQAIVKHLGLFQRQVTAAVKKPYWPLLWLSIYVLLHAILCELNLLLRKKLGLKLPIAC